jgi:hypothetical protein
MKKPDASKEDEMSKAMMTFTRLTEESKPNSKPVIPEKEVEFVKEQKESMEEIGIEKEAPKSEDYKPVEETNEAP